VGPVLKPSVYVTIQKCLFNLREQIFPEEVLSSTKLLKQMKNGSVGLLYEYMTIDKSMDGGLPLRRQYFGWQQGTFGTMFSSQMSLLRSGAHSGPKMLIPNCEWMPSPPPPPSPVINNSQCTIRSTHSLEVPRVTSG
jgi:hypothetical protein